jgi:predicted nucleotidyltransferase
MGSDRPEESFSARLGGRHPRCDFRIDVNVMLLAGRVYKSSMNRVLDYPPLTEETLQEVVRRILAVGSPIRIVFFGSRARGQARPGSDLDILIVEESDLPRYKRAARYLRALACFRQKMGGVDTGRGQSLGERPTHLHHHSPYRGKNALCPMKSHSRGAGFSRPRAIWTRQSTWWNKCRSAGNAYPQLGGTVAHTAPGPARTLDTSRATKEK